MATTCAGGYVKIEFDFTELLGVGEDQKAVPHRGNYRYDFTSGSGDNQVDKAWSDKMRRLAATSEDLDLSGGISDSSGTAITLSGLKVFLCKMRATTAGGRLDIGGAAANQVDTMTGAVNDEMYVLNDGLLLMIAPKGSGFGITAATKDLLKIDAGAGTIDFDLFVAGTD